MYFYRRKTRFVKNMEWILASASPRRKQLFSEIVQSFEIIPAKGEEDGRGLTGARLVETLAEQKATEVAALAQAKGKAVLGADTIVCLGERVLGKPRDKAEAVQMLSDLSGCVHEVYTGVCLILPSGTKELFSDCAKVRFKNLTLQEIEQYVETGSPMDKAGAYGIQDSGFVQEIQGSYSCVVGLPIELCKQKITPYL